MKKIIVLLLVSMPFLAFAQKGVMYGKPVCDPNSQTHFILKTSVLSPLLAQRGVRLGLEIPLDSFLTVQAGFGYYFSYNQGITTMDMTKPSYDTRLDLKYYFPKSSLRGLYTGPLFAYSKSYFKEGEMVANDYVDPISGQYVESLHADFSNPKRITQNHVDALWCIGLQPVVTKHFAINAYFGAGPRFTSNYIVTPVADNSENYHYESSSNKGVEFHSVFGLEVGYAF